MKESDWKQLSKLKPVALERYCRRVLDEIQKAASDSSKSFHERYGEVYSLIKERDKDLAWAFDDHRRSTAGISLAAITFLGLLTEEEISGFSDETRATDVRAQRWSG